MATDKLRAFAKFALIATQPARIEAIVVYSLAASLIVALTDGLKDAYRQIQARDEQLMVLNAELAHRIRNLLQIANALVGQSIDSAANPNDLKATDRPAGEISQE